MCFLGAKDLLAALHIAAAGEFVNPCSAVKASDLARSVAGNYGTARQNAEQLNQLIADIRERLRIANGE